MVVNGLINAHEFDNTTSPDCRKNIFHLSAYHHILGQHLNYQLFFLSRQLHVYGNCFENYTCMVVVIQFYFVIRPEYKHTYIQEIINTKAANTTKQGLDIKKFSQIQKRK